MWDLIWRMHIFERAKALGLSRSQLVIDENSAFAGVWSALQHRIGGVSIV